MTGADQAAGGRDPGAEASDPPCLRAALAMLRHGHRPIPVYPGQKKPIGTGWGLTRHTEASLRQIAGRYPDFALGTLLGADAGLIDLEVDDPEMAAGPLARLFPGGIPATLSFDSNKGPHRLFQYDPRFAEYGLTIIKGGSRTARSRATRITWAWSSASAPSTRPSRSRSRPSSRPPRGPTARPGSGASATKCYPCPSASGRTAAGSSCRCPRASSPTSTATPSSATTTPTRSRPPSCPMPSSWRASGACASPPAVRPPRDSGPAGPSTARTRTRRPGSTNRPASTPIASPAAGCRSSTWPWPWGPSATSGPPSTRWASGSA